MLLSSLKLGVARIGCAGISRMEKAGGKRGRNESVLGKRLEGMDESQLLKAVVGKLREDGGIGWREEYEVLRRNFELDNEGESEGKLKIKIKARNAKYLEEEVYTKSKLKWYMWIKRIQGW